MKKASEKSLLSIWKSIKINLLPLLFSISFFFMLYKVASSLVYIILVGFYMRSNKTSPPQMTIILQVVFAQNSYQLNILTDSARSRVVYLLLSSLLFSYMVLHSFIHVPYDIQGTLHLQSFI